jgi:hypothetical protein
MKNIIVNTGEAGEFLSYCVYFEIEATVVNKIYAFLDRPERLVFKMEKPFFNDQFDETKKVVPSLEYEEEIV